MKSNPKILVVDDNIVNVQLLEALLTPLGYDLLTAPDGKTALKVFDEGNIDLILLDVLMPGMDGFEVTRRIRENKEKQYVPIVCLDYSLGWGHLAAIKNKKPHIRRILKLVS